MANVLTQPYKRPRSAVEDNYLHTLAQPYDLAATVRTHGLGRVALAAFLRAHPSGLAPVWALANNNIGPRVWTATQPGDLVLFYGYREVYAYGFVSSKVYWPQNDAIWPSGTDWDYVYSLRDFHTLPAGARPSTDLLRPALGKFSSQSAQLHDMSTRGTTVAAVFGALFPGRSLPPSAGPSTPVTAPPRRPPSRPRPSSGPIGRTQPDALFTGYTPGSSDAVAPNWQARERGTLAHQQVVFQLQQLIAGGGYMPLYGEPWLNFDISWTDAQGAHVVEVKSLTAHNQADQIRLGLGQVLDYRWTYSAARLGVAVRAILVTEIEPTDTRWVDVCAAVGVLLTWPERMAADLGL